MKRAPSSYRPRRHRVDARALLRPWLVRASLGVCVLLAACGQAPWTARQDADIAVLTAPELQEALASGRLSAERVTAAFVRRIDSIDPALNAIIEVNPDALTIARRLDEAFATAGPVGPLHGVPVVLKANIDTGDEMVTSAGSLALAEHHAPDDAALVARLRQAGAVIIAKANLSEWANFRSTRSISGWSSLGGQTRNAYVLDRNPCGSSSGSAVAVAARLAPLAVGTETNGSIICPAATNGIVGIKPTVGLIEQDGIIPIAASQDTAGPMARTLAGAALLLDAMADPRTPVDSADLERGSLAGLRLGVIRDYPGATSSPPVEAAYEASLEILASAGAELVDPIELGIGERARDAELELLLFEFKDGIDRYLAASDAPLQNLRALIAFNEAHAETVMPWFDQEIFLMAATKPGLESAAYRQARADSIDSMRRSLDAVFAENDLDALIAPSNAGAWKIDIVHGDRFVVGSAAPAAISGYPSITIPGSLSDSLPLGLSFIGRAFEEAELLEIAAVFEARRGEFPAPTLIPSLESRTLFRE